MDRILMRQRIASPRRPGKNWRDPIERHRETISHEDLGSSRRRESAASLAASASSADVIHSLRDFLSLPYLSAFSTPASDMGRPFKQFLNGPRIYSCSNCRCHNADHDEILSKSFQGRHGRAYLFNNVVNVTLGPKEDRLLITGLHTVADIYCSTCQSVLGWKYEQAFEESQKYKEGKFIIEKAKMMKENW
eukprot:jgi/Mesvir1/27005/Mv20712-RA.1